MFSGDTDPLHFRVEKNLVNFSLSIDRSDRFFKISDIPEVEDFVLTTSGQIFGVGGNGDSVNLSVMRLESVSNLEIGVPNFESSVPSDRGEIGFEGRLGGGLQLRRISNLRNPVLMVMLFRGIFAISKSIPEFNFLISTRRNNLSVIRGETDGEDFFLVSNKLSHGLTGFEIPESEGLVPR